MFTNKLKHDLYAGKTCFGTFMCLNSTDVVEIGGLAGFDFVILDCEHGYLSPEATMHLVRAAQAGGTTPITRVTFNGETEILRALDVGSHGVQVPQINTREDAELAVRRAKYYPMGIRGSAMTRSCDYGKTPFTDYIEHENAETLVSVHIENIIGLPALDAPEISAKQGINIPAVLEDIVQNVPAPAGDPDAPLKALIFDSQYDPYLGVIVYFRVMEGTLKKGMGVKMMASGASYQVLDCGYLRPLGMDSCQQLTAGEVGWFTASIKNVKDTQVGDTITGADCPSAAPLPGYRPAQPMVFCGIYTEDGSKYPDLRDALDKLQLNDASLSFEPESSIALGFGFRCGFLGMLHMEIIQERLEREFDLDLVTTLPSVIYEVTKTDGTVVRVDNPHNYPDPGAILEAREPYAKVSIISPPDYVGNIMPMCQDRRGVFKDMQYLDTNLVELHYSMPIGEIIYDFFDALKARTKGYASLDYELEGYEPSELVKVDLLLNGDQVDALSFIAHRDKAYARARRICEKLKENIPRQLFEVPVQAAIGGKIIARETVKAMRKDVLAKCYGGDITRKKKLLEKQKEGKKKMRTLGTVQLPTEAFMAVLKLDEE